MKTLQQLIEESGIFQLTNQHNFDVVNKDPQLLMVTLVDLHNKETELIVGYFNEPQDITYVQIENLLKNLIRDELQKLINEIRELDNKRPIFKTTEIYDFGKLARSIGKATEENKESKEAIKYLVTEHNERVKKNKIYNKEVEYVIKLLNNVDSLIPTWPTNYLSILQFANYPYSKIYKSKTEKNEFVQSRIKQLIGTRNIANLFNISKQLDGHMWGSFCKKITLTKIRRIVCSELCKLDNVNYNIVENGDDTEKSSNEEIYDS